MLRYEVVFMAYGRRNNACFNGKISESAVVMEAAFAKNTEEDYRDRWQVPPTGMLKSNIDVRWSASVERGLDGDPWAIKGVLVCINPL